MRSVNEIEERIKRALLNALHASSPQVHDIRYLLHTDADGEPSILVYVILPDETPEADWRRAKLRPLEDSIWDALTREGVDWWPYFGFRSRSEQDELDADRDPVYVHPHHLTDEAERAAIQAREARRPQRRSSGTASRR